MRTLLLAVTLLFTSNAALAQSCADQAKARNLSGAALNSFVSKCESKVTMGKDECAELADQKKLEDGAKATFIRECVVNAKKKK